MIILPGIASLVEGNGVTLPLTGIWPHSVMDKAISERARATGKRRPSIGGFILEQVLKDSTILFPKEYRGNVVGQA